MQDRSDPTRIDPPGDAAEPAAIADDLPTRPRPSRTIDVPAAAPPPVVVPHYRLVRCIGRGGFGEVWLAEHELLRRPRACKLIRPESALELEGIRQLTERVPEHPNLMPISDIGSANGWIHCLMPLADAFPTSGPLIHPANYRPISLAAWMAGNENRDPDAVLAIARDLGAGLQHLHAHDVRHGDIKPQNVLRLAGRWVLADYGLARPIDAPHPGAASPHFAAPEGSTGPRADQYGLGILLCHVLTGQHPAGCRELIEQWAPGAAVDGIEDRLRTVIRRATLADPGERFASFGSLLAALELPDPSPSDTASPDADVDPVRADPPLGHRHVLVAGTLFGGLLAILAIALIAGPGVRSDAVAPADPTEESTAAAAVAVRPRIETFTVDVWEFLPTDAGTDDVRFVGALDGQVIRAVDTEDTGISVAVEFDADAYCYLVEFDPEGTASILFPPDGSSPPAVRSFTFPPGLASDPAYIPTHLHEFDVPGTHAIVLLSSSRPLPPWDEWHDRATLPTIRPASDDSRVRLYDGKAIHDLNGTRTLRAVTGRLRLDPLLWASRLETFDDVRALQFPVVGEPAGTGPQSPNPPR